MNTNRISLSLKKWPVLLAGLGLAGLSPLAQATTLPPVSFKDQVTTSDTIIRGRVVSSKSEVVDSSQGQAIVTKTKFETIETISGKAGEIVEIETLGGTANGVEMNVSGMPKLKQGAEYVLFVRNNGTAMCPLVGWDKGANEVKTNTDGSSFLILPTLLVEEAQKSLLAILEEVKKTTGADSLEVAKLVLSDETIKKLVPTAAPDAPATVTMDQFRNLVKYYQN